MSEGDHRLQGVMRPYLLRTVRVGVTATVLVLAALAGVAALPGLEVDRPGLYAGILVVAFAGALVVSRLPWPAFFERGLGHRVLYTWSVGDILLITGLLAATGGGRSELFWLYVLTTIFFAASYPIAGQVALTLLTAACYVLLGLATDTMPAAAVLLLRLSLLGLVAFMGSFLSRELMTEMVSHHRIAADVERKAQVLRQVTESARSLHDLETSGAVDGILAALDHLGFERSCICQIDEDGRRYRAIRGRELPAAYLDSTHEIDTGIVGEVFRSGRSVTIADYSRHERALEVIAASGVREVVASPVHVEGEVAAVLVGGTSRRGHLGGDHVEAFELLASLAGRALENAYRYQAQREMTERLRELDVMKTDFLATVSHELRTPLTVISGVGEMLAESWEQLDAPTREHLLQRSNANVASLRRIIASLLDMSVIQAGRMQPQLDEVDVSATLADAADRNAALLQEHAVVRDLPSGIRALADPDLLERVLDNLLVNVARHTPASTTLTLRAQAADGTVRVIVADDGPGMDGDVLSSLGDRFVRGGARDAGPGGLGLGLAVTAEILRLHDSALEVFSRPGEGTTCAFELTAAASPAGLTDTSSSRPA